MCEFVKRATEEKILKSKEFENWIPRNPEIGLNYSTRGRNLINVPVVEGTSYLTKKTTKELIRFLTLF